MHSSFLPVFSFVLGLIANTIAVPNLQPSKRLHEKRSHLPQGWTHLRKHQDPSASLPIRFALAQSNIDDIETHLYNVSHPDSPFYGNHWSPAQIASTFAPSAESIEAVRAWLSQSDVDHYRIKLSPTKGWLEVTSTVEEAENLLNAEYHVYEHETGTQHIACDHYHLPEHVAPHIEFVTPTIQFNAKLQKRDQRKTMTKSAPESSHSGIDHCDERITPDCLRALYDFFYEPVVPEKNSYGIVEYTPQAYLQSDLDMFARNFSTGLEGVSPTLVAIDGGIVQTSSKNFSVDSESALDLQYAMTLVTKSQNVTLYQVGDEIQSNATFNNFLDALDGTYCTYEGGDDYSQDSKYPDPSPGGYKAQDCGTVKPANVISTSYGSNEADVSVAYAIRQCNEYAKLGLMGVTVLYASGDDGVAGSDDLCLNPNGTQSTGGKMFNPGFPSTCPYVTAVGATQVSPGQTVWDPENTMQQMIDAPGTTTKQGMYSGGGFSNYFKMPKYQKDAVEGYLAANPISYSKDIYNATGSRAYPDISANGANYIIAADGEFVPIFGTSASSPVVGAMLTMVNDARLAIGKSPIGFINPLLYSGRFAGAFNDVTNGTNPGCGTLGFNASSGWDPVSGVGTMKFSALVTAWLDV